MRHHFFRHLAGNAPCATTFSGILPKMITFPIFCPKMAQQPPTTRKPTITSIPGVVMNTLKRLVQLWVTPTFPNPVVGSQ